MPPSAPITILEVGTTRTVCLVGLLTPDDQMTVMGVGVCPSTGVRKGEVTELTFAATSVRRAVEEASKSARCDIRSAWLVFSGGSTQATFASGRVVIPARTQVVDRASIAEALDLARSTALPDDRALLHPVVQNYLLDDSRAVLNPDSLPARNLQVNMQLIHTAAQNLEAMCNAVEEAQVEVTGQLFSGLCADYAVLTAEQRRAGVLLVNLGGGTTTYLAYADEAIAAAGSFAVGSDHVTTDIVQAFHLGAFKTADWLKINKGCAVLDGTAPNERATVPAGASLGGSERSLSQRSLNTVINARLDEVFKILRTSMDQQRLLSKLGAGIVLTGGGAYQNGITQLAGRIFEAPCCIGTMPPLGPVVDEQPAAYAAAYGALRLAAKELADAKDSKKSGGIFGRLTKGRTR